MLVIEVDGLSHWSDEAQKRDAQRDKALQLAGFSILRFTDEEILNNLTQVQETIEKWIEEKEK
jgi:very-short-patch-repair endonuclease